MGMVKCGENGLMLFRPESAAVNAFLTDSVLAIMTASGPAAASRPLFEAVLNSEDVGGGRASAGHGEGRSLTFASPARERNPSA